MHRRPPRSRNYFPDIMIFRAAFGPSRSKPLESQLHPFGNGCSKAERKFGCLKPEFRIRRNARSLQSLHGIQQSAHAVIRKMRGRHGLACRAGRRDRRFIAHLPRRGMRGHGSLHGGTGLHLSIRPLAGGLQRRLRTNVITALGEQMQHAFGAIRGPSGKENMILPTQRPTPMCGNKTFVPH